MKLWQIAAVLGLDQVDAVRPVPLEDMPFTPSPVVADGAFVPKLRRVV